MLSNTILTLLISLVFIHLSRSTQDDAETAFNEYYSLSQQLVENLTADIRGYELNQNTQLQKMQFATVDLLNDKLDDVVSKISQIEENLASVNLEGCTGGYVSSIEAQRSRLSTRIQKCTQLTSDTIANLINATYSDIEWQQNTLIGCYNRSLEECRLFGTDDACYDFVVDNIGRAKNNLMIVFDLIRVNFINKIISLKLPCQDLIEFEISVYPDYNLNTISQCAETTVRNSRPHTCPDENS